MALKVEVYQKEKVRPCSPTPQSLRNHKLSLLDILAGTFYNPFVFFYDSCAGGPRRHDYDELKDSLMKTLSVLYPLAGRIKDGSTIECNDEGADFVRANVTNCDLGEFLRHPKLEDIRQLLPLDPYPNAIDPAQPMLAVQLNRFRCGGTAVAFCIWHGLADGGAMTGLFNTWAAINRGERPINPGSLIVDASAIFRPVNLVRPPPMPLSLKNRPEKVLLEKICFWQAGYRAAQERLLSPIGAPPPSVSGGGAVGVHMGGGDTRNSTGEPKPQEAFSDKYGELAKEVEPSIPFTVPRQHLPRGGRSVGIGSRRGWKSYCGVSCRKSRGSHRQDYGRLHEGNARGGWISQSHVRLDFGWGKPIWIGLGHTLEDSAVFMDTEDGGIEVWIGLTQETHLLTNVVNLRKKLNPPFHSQCLGNVIQKVASRWESEADRGGRVTAGFLVGRVTEAIDKVTDDTVRKMDTEGWYLKTILVLSKAAAFQNADEIKVLNISSVCNLSFSQVDFGWGKPIWIGMGYTLKDLAIFLDAEEGGIEVLIGLTQDVMCNLDKDIEFNAYVSFSQIFSEPCCPLRSAL
nr:vinorine synthase-like [Ipomoea batatas]